LNKEETYKLNFEQYDVNGFSEYFYRINVEDYQELENGGLSMKCHVTNDYKNTNEDELYFFNCYGDCEITFDSERNITNFVVTDGGSNEHCVWETDSFISESDLRKAVEILKEEFFLWLERDKNSKSIENNVFLKDECLNGKGNVEFRMNWYMKYKRDYKELTELSGYIGLKVDEEVQVYDYYDDEHYTERQINSYDEPFRFTIDQYGQYEWKFDKDEDDAYNYEAIFKNHLESFVQEVKKRIEKGDFV
jgi:hypothetical protein